MDIVNTYGKVLRGALCQGQNRWCWILTSLTLALSSTIRSMKDLWDEDETDRCRDAFVDSIYKFPASPTRTLSNGCKMPLLGVGTWRAGQVQDTVEAALRKGFRLGHCICSLGVHPQAPMTTHWDLGTDVIDHQACPEAHLV